MSEQNATNWNWSIFAIVLAALLAKNASVGAFLQFEEFMLIPADERGQTIGVEAGWPVPLCGTEAYTLNVYWRNAGIRRATDITIDLVVVLLLSIMATLCLSSCARCREWRFNLRSALAFITLFGILLAEHSRSGMLRSRIGAFTWSVFSIVEAIVLVAIFAACYWVLTAAKTMLARLQFTP
jgi:hypothetical protein